MTKRLLAVGINRYPDAPLAGCVPDAQNIVAYAAAHGFDRPDYWTLVDEQASRNAIWASMLCIREDSMPDDVVYFHPSCHGCTMDVGYEKLHAICPVDFDWTLDRAITSKDIALWIDGFRPGVRIFLSFDSCFSGRMVDPMARLVANALADRPSPLQVPKVFPGKPTCAAEGVRMLMPTRTFRDVIAMSEHPVAYLSGCGSQQTSADTEIDGLPCGAFTHYLLEALNDAQTPDTAISLAMTLGARLGAAGYDQRPNAEGNALDLRWAE